METVFTCSFGWGLRREEGVWAYTTSVPNQYFFKTPVDNTPLHYILSVWHLRSDLKLLRAPGWARTTNLSVHSWVRLGTRSDFARAMKFHHKYARGFCVQPCAKSNVYWQTAKQERGNSSHQLAWDYYVCECLLPRKVVCFSFLSDNLNSCLSCRRSFTHKQTMWWRALICLDETCPGEFKFSRKIPVGRLKKYNCSYSSTFFHLSCPIWVMVQSVHKWALPPDASLETKNDP